MGAGRGREGQGGRRGGEFSMATFLWIKYSTSQQKNFPGEACLPVAPRAVQSRGVARRGRGVPGNFGFSVCDE